MSRLVATSGVFRRHHQTTLRRREMQQAITTHAEVLLPGLVVVEVELLKRHHNEEAVVDLALFDLTGGRWWVGRVVPRVEDLDFDVLMPTLVLRRSTYLSADVDRLRERVDAKHADAVAAIMHTEIPEVVTFVSNPDPSWFERVVKGEGLLAILERFSSADGDTLLRLNGSIPAAAGRRLGPCKPVPHTSGIYTLDGEADGIDDDQCCFALDGEHVSASATVAGQYVTLDLQAVVEDRPGQLTLWEIAPLHYEFRFEEESND